MKLDPRLLEQIIFASSIAFLLLIITCSVSLRQYKRRLLKLKKTERRLINLIKKASCANSIEQVADVKLGFDDLSRDGTFNKELSIKYAKAINYLEGKLACLVKQQEIKKQK